MAWIDPRYAAHQRKRWTRHDAHLWLRHDAHRFRRRSPDERSEIRETLPTRKPAPDVAALHPGYGLAEKRADPVIEAVRLTLILHRLRRERATLLRERALKAGFNPDQPRVPAGNSDGGQWTDGGGGSVGSGREGGGGADGNSDISAARRGNPRGGSTLSEQLRLDAARARSEHALNRVREIDPDWKPTPSFERINSMEGVIGRREAEAREADARYIELLRAGAAPRLAQRESMSSHEVLAPGGKLIGVRSGGDSDVRTVTPAAFERIHNELLAGAQPMPPSPRYDGAWFRRHDGSVIGLRVSEQHGLTIEVIESNHRLVRPNLKVHQR